MGILKSDKEEIPDAKKILDAIDKVEIAVQKGRREVREENKATRAHIGNEVATVRTDVAYMKNFMGRMLTAIKKLLGKMGIGTDDL